MRRLNLLGLLMFVGALLGCSEGPELVQVSGNVYLDDKPLTSGVVMFQPANGPPARGTIQPDGSYQLSTPGVGDGARVGKNRVRISCREILEGEGTALGKLLIPKRYTDVTTSELTAEVKADSNDPFDFHLTN